MAQIKDRLHILCLHVLGPSQCKVVGFFFFFRLYVSLIDFGIGMHHLHYEPNKTSV